MPVVSELIRRESDKTLSFGDYTLGTKSKLDNFDFQGDLYKVKTFNEVTKLERNGMELEPETEYDININGSDSGTMKTNLGGKLSLSVELDAGNAVKVKVVKK